MKTRFLSLDTSWVSFEHLKVLEWTSRPNIVVLQGLRNCWYACLTLTSNATSFDSDINIEQARVRGDSERLQQYMSLVRLVEVVNEGSAIDRDTTGASLHIHNRLRGFPLPKTPCSSLRIQLWLSWLLWERAAEIKQVDAIELDKVVWIRWHVCVA